MPEDGIPEKNLLYETACVRAVYARPVWGYRAHSVLTNFNSNAIVYMTPTWTSAEELQEDWRFMLMIQVMAILQEVDTGFVPILTPHKQEPADQMLVPQLSDILGVDV